MQTDINVNASTMVWVESLDNISFVMAVKVPSGKTLLGAPIDRRDLKIFAEDLIDGEAKHILHIDLNEVDAAALGVRLLSIVNGRW